MSNGNEWDDDVATAASEAFSDELENAKFSLVVTEGPDVGATFVIDPSQPLPMHIGQSETCALRLSDREVSRRHAALDVSGGRLRVTDLGSTNGTWIGDVSVSEVSVADGASLRMGRTVLMVRSAGQGSFPNVEATQFGRFVGGSPEVQRLFPLFERLAAADIPVVIEGETGTGKEVLAEALHELGPRAAGPFVVFDCTAVPPSLMEAELFGHERGSFTGATTSRKGYLEQAAGGTILIDEVGDLDLALQPKLLRAIERREFRRVGGTRAQHVDVRVLAATRRNLDRMVQEGRFRDDLYHRLAVARVELPPLRRRRGDVLLLARRFWSELGGEPSELTAHLVARWEGTDWPGNVRELRNTVARQIALGDVGQLAPSSGVPAGGDFMDAVLARRLPLPIGRREVTEEFERRYVEWLLEQHGGNVSRAAAAANLTRRYFQKVRARTRR